MKKYIKTITVTWIYLLIIIHGAVGQIIINTSGIPPVSPFLNQLFSQGGSGVHAILLYPRYDSSLGNPAVRVFGKLDRISPSPFTIEVTDTSKGLFLDLFPGVHNLTSGEMLKAFENFDENNLSVSGISLDELKVGNNYKLPDGVYRICFYAQARKYSKVPDLSNQCCSYDTTVYCCPRIWVLDGPSVDVANPGCATFTICNQAGGAPQFTQPINTLNINSEIPLVRPASPVIFTWLSPQTTCGLPPGGFKYDLEIWELFDNQNVTDAINNPFVFRKMGLPSTTFLLDTNLNRNVLQEGKKYAIRVRAVSAANVPVDIDNDGYSRIEAFQYGSNLTITQNSIPVDPQDYYIPYIERNTNYWDDVYKGIKNNSRSDTLMPIREYIAFALTRNETAYSLDAIDLFLALNPELADEKNVKISYDPQLPVFPQVAENDRMNFNKEHQINLEPNGVEKNKFIHYLDTLNNYKQKTPDKAVKLINDLISHLNSTKAQIDSIDRVTINYVNMVLAELLYELRLYSKGMNNSQYNQIQGLVSTVMDLTAESLADNTSFYHPFIYQKKSSLSSYENVNKINIRNSFRLYFKENDSGQSVLAAIAKQLLPFDVVVWRNSKEPPYKPVLDAPDLVASYRIFYTLSKLYNHRNPEVNAKSSNRLASTIQVSLPSNTVFTFWTLNMINHKTTTAKDVDLKNVLEQMQKVSLNSKKPSIVIKIE